MNYISEDMAPWLEIPELVLIAFLRLRNLSSGISKKKEFSVFQITYFLVQQDFRLVQKISKLVLLLKEAYSFV